MRPQNPQGALMKLMNRHRPPTPLGDDEFELPPRCDNSDRLSRRRDS